MTGFSTEVAQELVLAAFLKFSSLAFSLSSSTFSRASSSVTRFRSAVSGTSFESFANLNDPPLRSSESYKGKTNGKKSCSCFSKNFIFHSFFEEQFEGSNLIFRIHFFKILSNSKKKVRCRTFFLFYRFIVLLPYFNVTFAPAASNFFLMSSASSFLRPSFTIAGAPSTISFASFNPSPRTSLMTLMTAIF